MGQAGLRRLQRGFRVQDLFTADASGLGQLLAAADVALGSSQFGLRAQNVGTAQVDIGGQRVVLHVVSADLAHHLGQPGLSLLQRHVGVSGVQAHQRLAGCDGLGIVGLDGHDGTGHLRRDLHQVAVYVGIVGAFEVGAEKHPPDAIGDGDENEDAGRDQQEAFAGGVGGGGGSVHDV
ncbi:hypothetical protein D3C72_1091370 [compost metagenome]